LYFLMRCGDLGKYQQVKKRWMEILKLQALKIK